MFVKINGGVADIDPKKFRNNIHAATMISGHNPGLEPIYEGRPIPLYGTAPVPLWGDWWPVADSSVRLVMNDYNRALGAVNVVYRQAKIALADIFWSMPDGSRIKIPAGDVRYTLPILENFNVVNSELSVSQVSIRLSRATLPGLVARGIVSRANAARLTGDSGWKTEDYYGIELTNPKEEGFLGAVAGGVTSSIEGINETIQSTQSTIRVVAIVAAIGLVAWYFLPARTLIGKVA